MATSDQTPVEIIVSTELVPPVIPKLSIHNVQVGKLLGKGAFSEVLEVKAIESVTTKLGDPEKLVFKRIRTDRPCPYAVDELQREAHILPQLHQHHIIELKATIHDSDDQLVGLVLERCDEALLDRINSWAKQKRSQSRSVPILGRKRRKSKSHQLFYEQLRIIDEMVSAFEYLHSHRIMFRDLKPENCGFVDGVFKIFDFGSAIQLESRSTVLRQKILVGSHPYCAPELALGKKCGLAVDAYSVGILAWEMLQTKEPFSELMAHQYIDQVVHRGRQLKMDPNWPPELQAILTRAWHMKPAHRPSMSQVRAVLQSFVSDYTETEFSSSAE